MDTSLTLGICRERGATRNDRNLRGKGVRQEMLTIYQGQSSGMRVRYVWLWTKTYSQATLTHVPRTNIQRNAVSRRYCCMKRILQNNDNGNKHMARYILECSLRISQTFRTVLGRSGECRKLGDCCSLVLWSHLQWIARNMANYKMSFLRLSREAHCTSQ